MTTIEPGRWLLAAIAIVGLALGATAVGAHGTDTATDHPYNGTEAPPYDGDAAEWTDWMENHMTEHMGPGSVAWMEAHVGVTVEEMAQHVAGGNYTAHGAGYLPHEHPGDYGPGSGGHDDTHRDDSHRGGYGMAGHGC